MINISEVTFDGALIDLLWDVDLIPEILPLLIEVSKLGLEWVHDLIDLVVLCFKDTLHEFSWRSHLLLRVSSIGQLPRNRYWRVELRFEGKHHYFLDSLLLLLLTFSDGADGAPERLSHKWLFCFRIWIAIIVSSLSRLMNTHSHLWDLRLLRLSIEARLNCVLLGILSFPCHWGSDRLFLEFLNFALVVLQLRHEGLDDFRLCFELFSEMFGIGVGDIRRWFGARLGWLFLATSWDWIIPRADLPIAIDRVLRHSLLSSFW